MELLQRLRASTRDLHENIEQVVPVLHPDFTLAEYTQLLRRYYGFYAPLDPVKAEWLHRDLLALGDTEAQIDVLPRCQNLPAPGWGCRYVLEGATLGGQILARTLESRFGLTPEHGAAFFAGYGAETGSHWKRFGESLALETKPEDEDLIIAAARDRFLKFHAWLAGGSP